MGIKRVINVDFWNDEKVMDMFSPEDKLFMLYLLTNPHTTQLGVYAINPKHISFEMGYTIEVVNVLLDRFENSYKLIKYSHKTKEIAIKNFLKHSIVKGGKPVEDCLTKEISKVKDKSLLQFVYEGINEYENLNQTVKNILSLLNVNDNDIDNDNDNDNDNERYVHESSTNRENYIKSYEILKEETLKNKEKGGKKCDWCGCNTTVLHKHHYPVPKRLGGTDIVNICSNCHAEFHSKEASLYGGTDSNLETTRASKNFIPPSVEEVKAYCEERNNGIDATAFIDFYTAKGWLIGKNKMKDWKAAVRTWERHEHSNNKGVNHNGSNQQHTFAGQGKYGTWL